MELQLASQSPRRRELLTQIGVRYTTVSVDVPEVLSPEESPEDYVSRLALAKARAGCEKSPGRPTLGADTIVCCDSLILEKPRDEADCRRMLSLLSARTHQVMTAVAICDQHSEALRLSTTEVEFRALQEQQMAAYWHTGEPQDKAGAYAIQGLGGVFVKSIRGSYSGVVGLPIEALYELLDQFNIPVWRHE